MESIHFSGKLAMALTQSLLLRLHPADYRQLAAAASHSNQDIGDLIRLAIHRETAAILAGSPSCRKTERKHTSG